MDLLSKRYASPFLLLDSYIETGCFEEFVDEFVKLHNQEQEEKTMWEIWLHRRHDLSWDEFVNLCKQPPQKPDKPVDFGTAIKESKNILDGFVPE